MRHTQKFIIGILIVAGLLFIAPTQALAEELLTQMGGNQVIVPGGQTVGTVAVIGTDVRLAGTVTDAVVVINGDVYLDPTAKVDLVIDLGGHVHNSSQNSTRNGIYEINFTQSFFNELFIAGTLVFGLWFVKVVLSLFAIVFLTGLGYFLEKRFSRAEQLIASSTPRLFGIGTALAMVITAAIVLLSLTIIGIPLAALIFFVTLIAAMLGILPLIKYTGERVLSEQLLSYPVLTRWLIEAVIFVALVNLPLVGFLFFLGSGIVGLGLVLTLIWMRPWKKRQGNNPNE